MGLFYVFIPQIDIANTGCYLPTKAVSTDALVLRASVELSGDVFVPTIQNSIFNLPQLVFNLAMVELTFNIVNNRKLRVADVRANGSSEVISVDKNQPATLNQEWKISVLDYDFSSGTYKVTLQTVDPLKYAGYDSGKGTVINGASSFQWTLEPVNAPFGGATSFRIGTGRGGPYWTAGSNNKDQIKVKSNTYDTDQLWTFVEVAKPGQPHNDPDTA
ncbi:hypothetical protein NM688_g9065 [Phlebia brevispora]|uniref:Uncharacterized protein n=1 Tax=Phlebia brevispora TaxID=194682 RepID=A0ACC1RL65_9APHY|nr:hypothetical protein NM688_g9065 [Phlebia brevispora]